MVLFTSSLLTLPVNLIPYHSLSRTITRYHQLSHISEKKESFGRLVLSLLKSKLLSYHSLSCTITPYHTLSPTITHFRKKESFGKLVLSLLKSKLLSHHSLSRAITPYHTLSHKRVIVLELTVCFDTNTTK